MEELRAYGKIMYDKFCELDGYSEHGYINLLIKDAMDKDNYGFIKYLISLDDSLAKNISRDVFMMDINRMKLYFINLELKFVSFYCIYYCDDDTLKKFQWLIDQKIKIDINCLHAMIHREDNVSIINLVYDNCEPGNLEFRYSWLNDAIRQWIHEKFPDAVVHDDIITITKN